MLPLIRFSCIFIFCLFIAACHNHSKEFAFTESGSIQLVEGDSFANAASGGPGNAVITYSSSNNSIATVDSNGQVTVLSSGSVTISANKSDDTISYVIDAVDKNFTVSAWIGTSGSEVTILGDVNGVEFYRSSEINCDLENYGSCADGQLDVLTGSSIIDTSVKLGQEGYYTFAYGDNQVSTSVSVGTMPARIFSQTVIFKGQLWMVGGQTMSGSLNDVWSSSNGSSWTEQTASAAFSARYGHQLVVFNDQLWVIGGNDGSDLNDVWSSSDGTGCVKTINLTV